MAPPQERQLSASLLNLLGPLVPGKHSSDLHSGSGAHLGSCSNSGKAALTRGSGAPVSRACKQRAHALHEGLLGGRAVCKSTAKQPLLLDLNQVQRHKQFRIQRSLHQLRTRKWHSSSQGLGRTGEGECLMETVSVRGASSADGQWGWLHSSMNALNATVHIRTDKMVNFVIRILPH